MADSCIKLAQHSGSSLCQGGHAGAAHQVPDWSAASLLCCSDVWSTCHQQWSVLIVYCSLLSISLLCLLCSSVEQVVPLLKQVLAKMLPMLGAAKVENMQWVFSNGVCVLS